MSEFYRGQACVFRGEKSSDIRFVEGRQCVVVDMDWNTEWKYQVFVYDLDWRFLGATWCGEKMLEKRKMKWGRREWKQSV